MDAPYSSSRNSFHLMRLVPAALVILCHSHTLLARATPLSAFTGGQMNEGSLAVDGFLTISGFLICQSGGNTGGGPVPRAGKGRAGGRRYCSGLAVFRGWPADGDGAAVEMIRFEWTERRCGHVGFRGADAIPERE